ncbi:MAG: hypothetical protein M3209_10500 [Acidobacteriota bacterium]|nr:hypothetical protein [Acidobacteriota bacterium]
MAKNLLFTAPVNDFSRVTSHPSGMNKAQMLSAFFVLSASHSLFITALSAGTLLLSLLPGGLFWAFTKTIEIRQLPRSMSFLYIWDTNEFSIQIHFCSHFADLPLSKVGWLNQKSVSAR